MSGTQNPSSALNKVLERVSEKLPDAQVLTNLDGTPAWGNQGLEFSRILSYPGSIEEVTVHVFAMTEERTGRERVYAYAFSEGISFASDDDTNIEFMIQSITDWMQVQGEQ